MWRASIFIMLLSLSAPAWAQQQPVDPALNVAIDEVCRRFLLDAAAPADIPALQGKSRTGDMYNLSETILVAVRPLGQARACQVQIRDGDAAIYRPALLEAAGRWPVPLTSRGELPTRIASMRQEIFCPPDNRVPAWWTIFERDSGRISLAITFAPGSATGCPAALSGN